MESKFNRINQEEAKKMMDENRDYIILDVRTKEEFDNGRIKGAINIPLEDIEDDTLNTDRDKMLFVYCRSGHRSVYAARELSELGYTNVYEFGGIINWKYETEK